METKTNRDMSYKYTIEIPYSTPCNDDGIFYITVNGERREIEGRTFQVEFDFQPTPLEMLNLISLDSFGIVSGETKEVPRYDFLRTLVSEITHDWGTGRHVYRLVKNPEGEVTSLIRNDGEIEVSNEGYVIKPFKIKCAVADHFRPILTKLVNKRITSDEEDRDAERKTISFFKQK